MFESDLRSFKRRKCVVRFEQKYAFYCENVNKRYNKRKLINIIIVVLVLIIFIKAFLCFAKKEIAVISQGGQGQLTS